MKHLIITLMTIIVIALGSPVLASEVDLSKGKHLYCFALNLHQEARGEPLEGILAVGQVVINRMDSKRWPDTACGVIKQGKMKNGNMVYQFSWMGKTMKAIPYDELHNFIAIASGMLNGTIYYKDPYITHYYACSGTNRINKPHWAHAYKFVKQIGNHCFYSERLVAYYERFETEYEG